MSARVTINSTGEQGWERYTGGSMHVTLYHPAGWTISELPSSEISRYSKIDASEFLENAVRICAPATGGCIMILCGGFTGPTPLVYDDQPENSEISGNTYQQFVDTVTGMIPALSNGTVITGIRQDTRYYTVNGYAARFAAVTLQNGGRTWDTDAYLVTDVHNFYVMVYIPGTGSSVTEASAASDIMRTFSAER